MPSNGFGGSNQNLNINGYKKLNESPSDKYDSNQVYFQTQQMDNFLEKEKIAAANIAAAAALKKEKEKEIYMSTLNSNNINNSNSSKNLNFNSQQSSIPKSTPSSGGGNTATKVISNFYTITKHQIELLPVSYYTLISKN